MLLVVNKEPAYWCRRHKRHGFNRWVGKIPWRRGWQPTPVFLPGESSWTEKGAWRATVLRVTKSWTRLNEHTCMRKARRIRQDSFLINNDYNLSEVNLLSRVWPFATPWTVAHQAPPSMGFSRQGYWSGLPFPSLGSPPLQADALTSEPPGKPDYNLRHSSNTEVHWPALTVS